MISRSVSKAVSVAVIAATIFAPAAVIYAQATSTRASARVGTNGSAIADINNNLDARGRIVHTFDLNAPDIRRIAPISGWQTRNAPATSTSNNATSSTKYSPSLSTMTASPQTNASPQTTASTNTTTLGPNLIQNPSLETAGSNGLPAGWYKGGYGTNTRVLTYPVSPAEDGSKAASVAITSYTSGDAKWYFAPVAVTPGDTYQFSDYSTSSVPSEIDVQLKMSDGSYKYIVLGKPAASSSYQRNQAQFTVPAGVVSLTVFHVIDKVGTLTVDNYSLQQVTQSQGAPNLVQNGDFETAGSDGLPVNWTEGGYGNNARTFAYPVAGVGGSKAAEVSITNYSSGDAAWYYTPIQMPAGIYTYSDAYKSDTQSVVEIQYHNADGSYTYEDLQFDPAQSSFTNETIGFVVPTKVQDVLVYHLIQSVGSLTIDNVAVQPNTDTNGVFGTGGVTLTFDNGWLSQLQNAIPEMNKFGFKGTFYIITHELSDYGYSGFVSKAQIQQMYAMGEEIGSHTQTHPYLTQLSPSQQWQEINGSRQDLLALNVGPIDSFAYPFGDYDSTTIQLVQQAGYTNARSTIDGYAVPDSDIYQLPRFVVLNTSTPAQMEQWINEAIAEKAWLIIEFHQVDTSNDTYAITPANFDTLMAYLAQKKVPVVTMAQGVQDLQK